MGIDCVDVRQVIHWGQPSDVKSYIQECGRARRNCQPANAFGKGMILSHTISVKTWKVTVVTKLCADEPY